MHSIELNFIELGERHIQAQSERESGKTRDRRGELHRERRRRESQNDTREKMERLKY